MIETALNYDGARRAPPAIEWLRSPWRPALQVASALDRVRRAPTILEAMRFTPEVLRVTDEAVRDGVGASSLLPPILEAIEDDRDTVTALAAIHALARVPGTASDAELTGLVLDRAPGHRDHALWAMIDRGPIVGLCPALAVEVALGAMPGMFAQRTLRRWADAEPGAVLGALEATLGQNDSEAARRRLVETIGLVPGRHAQLTLERVAVDVAEAESVRRTAVAAFAERGDESLPSSIGRLAVGDARISDAVHDVRAQRRFLRRSRVHGDDRLAGLRVAQVHLAATLDPAISQAGVGDTGGIATLVSRLGGELSRQPRVAEVITIGRSLAGERRPSTRTYEDHRFESVPLEPGEGVTFTGAWPAMVAAERGIRTALLAGGVPDVIHLRMADPGSLAAATVAAELSIPTVFSLAPDPQGPIATAEQAGDLDRTGFAAADAESALWFRANLVEQLTREAREVALFPRPDLRRQLTALVGVDVAAGRPRYTVVPEGVDTRRIDRALEIVADGWRRAPVIDDLRRAIAALPPARHGLPLAVSVGRMHEIKGMARIVEAFATDPGLAGAANLVIVGGDLDDPSESEAAELARIRELFAGHRGLRDRVVLLGHRPNDDVGLVLAAARLGSGPHVGPGGVYVCGSRKEEFGLAIVEAMAAGLPVVAPRTGGPATYIEDGLTGLLVDTVSGVEIASGLRLALGLGADPQTARRTRARVDERYTLEHMARGLAAVYRLAAGARTLAHPVRRDVAA